MANLKQLLLQLHLSPKETAVFLSLIKLGKTTATAVSREAGITRTHVYDIAQELANKGLMSEVEERGVKVYEATDHAGIMAYLSRQQKELVTLEKTFAEAASEFNALQAGRIQKTKVRFFDGVEGVKNIYAEIQHDLKQQTKPFELSTIFSPQNLERVMPGFGYLIYPLMQKRDIVSADTMAEYYNRKMTESGYNSAYKMWPAGSGLFPTDTICWPNKITYIDLVGYPSGIIIENASMIATFRLWFNQLWESLG